MSITFNKYRILNFQPNDVILFSISVLSSFQFLLLCQANIDFNYITLIKRNWKELKKQNEKNLTSLGVIYFGSVIYFPKIFLDSIMFQVMLVILWQNITRCSFLPRIEIMMTLVDHVLNVTVVLGGTTNATAPT